MTGRPVAGQRSCESRSRFSFRASTVPIWVIIAYATALFVIGLIGMAMANISGRRYLRWLKKAQELSSSHGAKILYYGELPIEDQQAMLLLVDRIDTARDRLLADPARPLSADAEARVFAALRTLADFLVLPTPEPLPATLGLLDSDIEVLKAGRQAMMATAKDALMRALSAIEDLEALAAGASAGARELAAEQN